VNPASGQRAKHNYTQLSRKKKRTGCQSSGTTRPGGSHGGVLLAIYSREGIVVTKVVKEGGQDRETKTEAI